MPNVSNPARSKRLMLIFLAFVVLVIGGIVCTMLLAPSESGVMVPTAGSGNLSFGGHMGAHKDLIYYRAPDGGLRMRDLTTGKETDVSGGDCSFINVGDEWVTFLRDGDIMRLLLGHAIEPQTIVSGEQCRGLSVNGPWIYYTDGQGAMWKLNPETDKKIPLGNSLAIDQFTVDNRRVVFLSGGTLYHMQTDGADLQRVGGERVERFLYTNDSVYYWEDGRIRRIYSLVGKLDDSKLYFGEIDAAVFNFEVVQDGSKLYYAGEEGIVELLLQTPVQASEKKTVLSDATDVVSLYLAEGAIYYFDSQGQFHSVDLDADEEEEDDSPSIPSGESGASASKSQSAMSVPSAG